MSDDKRQLVATWVDMLQSVPYQISPWNQSVLVQYQSVLDSAQQEHNPLLVFEYLQQVGPIAISGRGWYRLMLPVRLLGKLLYTPIVLLYMPFTRRFYARLFTAWSGRWGILWGVFGALTLISFIGLVMYHRNLYDHGTDLGWTYGHALLFALILSWGGQSIVLFLWGQALSLTEYWSQWIPRMI